MPSLKLVYFNFPGRAEPARLMLAHKNVKYEDKRISFEEFAQMKPSKKS
jgi:hypothetical protein